MLDLAKRQDYSVFLASHFLAHTALEPAFATLPDAIRPPAMATLLADDLIALGTTIPSTVPAMFDGNATGAAYMIAEANFGRRALLKRWSCSDDPVVASAGSYLASPALADYAPVIDAHIDTIDDRAGVLQGIEDAIHLFDRCLAQVKSTHLPLQCGGRLARNASIPSRKSSLM